LDTGILIQRLLGSSKYALQKSNQQYQYMWRRIDISHSRTMWLEMKVNEKDHTVPNSNVHRWFSQQYSMLVILQHAMAYLSEPPQCTTKKTNLKITTHCNLEKWIKKKKNTIQYLKNSKFPLIKSSIPRICKELQICILFNNSKLLCKEFIFSSISCPINKLNVTKTTKFKIFRFMTKRMLILMDKERERERERENYRDWTSGICNARL
jgi:hypothetical protein